MDTPAPWTLSGREFILMYRFPEEFIRESCFLPDEWKDLKWSGLGYVMLTDFKWTQDGRRHLIQVGSFMPWLEIVPEPGSIPFRMTFPVAEIEPIDGNQ